MDEQRRSRSTESFYGRRRGKTLRSGQIAALEHCLDALALDLSKPAPADIQGLFDASVTSVCLEIGFGGGEHLLHRIMSETETGFLGVEPFVNGVAKLAAALDDRMPANLRIHDNDAVQVLDWLPNACLDGIDLLYPDPWPKRRHWKRRFVNRTNLDRFARVMKQGSVFRFASDIDTYVNWTLLHFHAHPAFEWQAQSAADWDEPFMGWPGTRYEAKALREGRRPAYLRFLRI